MSLPILINDLGLLYIVKYIVKYMFIYGLSRADEIQSNH